MENVQSNKEKEKKGEFRGCQVSSKLDVRMSPCQKLTAVVGWQVWVVSK